MAAHQREVTPRITQHLGGGRVEVRCSLYHATWSTPLTGRIQLTAGHKPLWVERMRIGLRPEFCTDIWRWEDQETVSWNGLNLAPDRTQRLKFSMNVRPGSVLGPHTVLETEIQLWHEAAWLIALEIPVLPSTEFTVLASLLQEIGGLEPPEWSRPSGTFDALATFAPGATLHTKLDDVSLYLLRERNAMSGELILNERERTPLDYLRAARGRDKRVLSFRWALGDLDAARAFFANAFRPYVDGLVQLPIPASASTTPIAQLPVPVGQERSASLEDFLMPPGAALDALPGFILPESSTGTGRAE